MLFSSVRRSSCSFASGARGRWVSPPKPHKALGSLPSHADLLRALSLNSRRDSPALHGTSTGRQGPLLLSVLETRVPFSCNLVSAFEILGAGGFCLGAFLGPRALSILPAAAQNPCPSRSAPLPVLFLLPVTLQRGEGAAHSPAPLPPGGLSGGLPWPLSLSWTKPERQTPLEQQLLGCNLQRCSQEPRQVLASYPNGHALPPPISKASLPLLTWEFGDFAPFPMAYPHAWAANLHLPRPPPASQ